MREDIESDARSYCLFYPARFVGANGSYLIAETGDKHLDFLAGCGSLNYGHNDKAMQSSTSGSCAPTDGEAGLLTASQFAKLCGIQRYLEWKSLENYHLGNWLHKRLCEVKRDHLFRICR